MVSTGDHIRLLDKQTSTNVEGSILNAYWFEVTSITAPEPLANIREQLEDYWTTLFLPRITALQSNAVKHTGVQFDNADHPETDFVDIAFDLPIAGSVSQNFNNSASAWSILYVRSTRVTRHGHKRIGGVPNNAFDNGEVTGSYVTPLSQLLALLEAPPTIDLDTAGTMSIVPVIPKSASYVGGWPTIYNNVQSVQFRGAGTQNTRKNLLGL